MIGLGATPPDNMKVFVGIVFPSFSFTQVAVAPVTVAFNIISIPLSASSTLWFRTFSHISVLINYYYGKFDRGLGHEIDILNFIVFKVQNKGVQRKAQIRRKSLLNILYSI
jgi:hypothetical protein